MNSGETRRPGQDPSDPVSATERQGDISEGLMEKILAGYQEVGPPPIFMLQAPRTGCTLLYQTVLSAFRLPYFSNFANQDFPAHPEMAVAIQLGLPPVEINFSSDLGKTMGPLAPSEGSAVMQKWFGGGHPSQTVSNSFVPGGREAFQRSISAIRRMSIRPLVIKNAWNSFRLEAILEACPGASFIWSRRDVRDAARSDLMARLQRFGTPKEWSSATPANYRQLLELPPEQHLVENQFEFYKATQPLMAKLPPERVVEVWYEDLVSDPQAEIERIAGRLACLQSVSEPELSQVSRARLSADKADARTSSDPGEWRGAYEAIGTHVEENRERYASLLYEDRASDN